MFVFPAFLGLLFAGIVSAQIIIQPREATTSVNSSLEVICKVDYALEVCRVMVGGKSYYLKISSDNNSNNIVYHGQGLEYGECGVQIKNVSEEMNGDVTCAMVGKGETEEKSAVMRLTVAHAPNPPTLFTPSQSSFLEGDIYRARCEVSGGRPAAKILWFLDDIILESGRSQEVITTDEATDLQTVSQNITFELGPDHNGKKLICRSEHQASPLNAEQETLLIVHYPPKPEAHQLTVFGLKLGASGRLNVTVRASPAPQAEWRVAGRAVPREGADGLTPLQPLELGNGYYNCSLLITEMEKEHVDRQYTLALTNEYGSETVSLRLSTLDEPAGMELDAGAIVGIVIAVLILLIGVFLAVFARATDRWCFAGNRRRDAKESGESTPAGDVLLESRVPLPANTDTESAGGNKPERSRLAELSARVRAVLPRGRDKVQSTDVAPADGEEKPLSEEKKGVVYAELALGDGGRDKPAPPSTEYAEIVYTTTETAPTQTPPADQK